jgi:hypothetical protein
VLLVANNDAGFCIQGAAFPTTVDDRGQELVSEEQLDIQVLWIFAVKWRL